MDVPEEADAYARADFDDVNQAFVDRLLEFVGPLETAHAVDLGTGPADIPIRVARARPGWRIVAVDASPAMLEIARGAIGRAGLAHAVEPTLADAKDSRLPDHAFDVVFSNSILHHINDTDRFWDAARRIGRPGAWAFLRDLYRPATSDAARRIVRRYSGEESELLQEEFYRSLMAAYTPDEIRAQLARAGLDALEVSLVTDRHVDITGRLPD